MLALLRGDCFNESIVRFLSSHLSLATLVNSGGAMVDDNLLPSAIQKVGLLPPEAEVIITRAEAYRNFSSLLRRSKAGSTITINEYCQAKTACLQHLNGQGLAKLDTEIADVSTAWQAAWTQWIEKSKCEDFDVLHGRMMKLKDACGTGDLAEFPWVRADPDSKVAQEGADMTRKYENIMTNAFRWKSTAQSLCNTVSKLPALADHWTAANEVFLVATKATAEMENIKMCLASAAFATLLLRARTDDFPKRLKKALGWLTGTLGIKEKALPPYLANLVSEAQSNPDALPATASTESAAPATASKGSGEATPPPAKRFASLAAKMKKAKA